MSKPKGIFDNPNYFNKHPDNIIDDKKENKDDKKENNSIVEKKETRQKLFDDNRTLDDTNISLNLELNETSNLTLDESNYFDLTNNLSQINFKNNLTDLDLLSNIKELKDTFLSEKSFDESISKIPLPPLENKFKLLKDKEINKNIEEYNKLNNKEIKEEFNQIDNKEYIDNIVKSTIKEDLLDIISIDQEEEENKDLLKGSNKIKQEKFENKNSFSIVKSIFGLGKVIYENIKIKEDDRGKNTIENNKEIKYILNK